MKAAAKKALKDAVTSKKATVPKKATALKKATAPKKATKPAVLEKVASSTKRTGPKKGSELTKTTAPKENRIASLVAKKRTELSESTNEIPINEGDDQSMDAEVDKAETEEDQQAGGGATDHPTEATQVRQKAVWAKYAEF